MQSIPKYHLGTLLSRNKQNKTTWGRRADSYNGKNPKVEDPAYRQGFPIAVWVWCPGAGQMCSWCSVGPCLQTMGWFCNCAWASANHLANKLVKEESDGGVEPKDKWATGNPTGECWEYLVSCSNTGNLKRKEVRGVFIIEAAMQTYCGLCNHTRPSMALQCFHGFQSSNCVRFLH